MNFTFSHISRLLALATCFLATASVGQYYDLGQDPASIRWRQIRSEHFQIIYPEDFEANANLLCHYLEVIYRRAETEFGSHPRRTSVIIHNRSSRSNGHVLWAPKRMEIYPTPSPTSYGQAWLQQLAIHEFKHVIQMDRLNQGLTKLLNILFGEHATALVTGLFLPGWFLEGDAVYTETSFSRAGRGRMPGFSMPLRAQVTKKGVYSYDKATLGSYTSFVPNRYILGYHLVQSVSDHYGEQTWLGTVDYVARHPWCITAFSKGLKKHTGFSKLALYRSSMQVLDSVWQSPPPAFSNPTGVVLSPADNHYTNYTYPGILGTDSVVCLRSGLNDIDRITWVSEEGQTTTLFTPGYRNEDRISAAGAMMCWAEHKPDLRWQGRTYSVIKCLNTTTGKVKTLTHKSRLQAPALSADASRIACIQTDEQLNCKVVIVDTETGAIIHTYPSYGNHALLSPAWVDSTHLVVVAIEEDGKSLMRLNTATNTWEVILPPTRHDISNPANSPDYILFTASFTGINNLFGFNKTDRQIVQITAETFGADFAVASEQGDFIIYSSYTENGYRLVRIPCEQAQWQLYTPLSHEAEVASTTSSARLTPITFSSDSMVTYPSKKYRKHLHLLNIHSWAPASVDISNTALYPGVSVMSQNKLSTVFIMAGYDLQKNRYYGSFRYAGLYPVITLSADQLERNMETLLADGSVYQYDRKEQNISMGISVPLNLTSNRFSRYISPEILYTKARRMIADNPFITLLLPEYDMVAGRIYAHNLLKSSHRDINPRWGQMVDLYYSMNPFDQMFGSIRSVQSLLYFPGVMRHHSLHLYAAAQDKEHATNFYDRILYPRGYLHQFSDRLYTLRCNYLLPLSYPDYSLGAICYVKRINLNIFGDAATGTDLENSTRQYRSFGTEITAEFHLFRFYAPLQMGIRTAFVAGLAKPVTEFLFSVDLESF